MLIVWARVRRKKESTKKLKYLSNQRQFFAILTEFSCIPKQSDNLSNVFIKILTEMWQTWIVLLCNCDVSFITLIIGGATASSNYV